MKKPLKIWFDEHGNLLNKVGYWATKAGHTNKTEDAHEFQDTMEYISLNDYVKGSARLHVKSTTTGRKYSMFVSDFHDVVTARRFLDNQISGTFRLIKKGQAQAIKLIIEKAP